jgi:Putative Flp pilus-assembly TadE/G-like
VIGRYFTRLCRRDGQSLVVFAVAVPVLLIFLAFVVDAAHAFVDYRHLQNTADSVALATAQDIGDATCTNPALPSCLEPTANRYSSTYNSGPAGLVPCDPSHTTNCYEWPYNSQPDVVLVKLSACTSTFFGGVIGVSHICASVSSTANATYLKKVTSNTVQGTTQGPTTLYTTSTTITPPAANAGLFALNSNCGTSTSDPSPIMLISNKHFEVQGSVYSNGGIHTDTSYTFDDQVIYNGTCGQPASGNFGVPASSGSYPAGQPSPTGGGQAYPYILTSAQLTTICDGALLNTAAAITSAQITSKGAGVYCSDTSITPPNKSMTITMIAPHIILTGTKSQNLTGYLSTGPANAKLLAYVLGPDYPSPYPSTPASTELKDTANGATLIGDIIAPDTTVDLEGPSVTTGFVEAESMILSQNNSIVGDGPASFIPPTSGTTTIATSTVLGTTIPGTTNYNTVTTGTVEGLTGGP